MAVLVVHRLEVIDVDHRERERHLAIRRRLELRGQPLQQELAVVRPRQRVRRRHAVEPHVLDVERDRRRDEPHELQRIRIERADPLARRRHGSDPLAPRHERHAQQRGDRRLIAGQRLEPTIVGDVVDQRRLATLHHPARDPLADGERQRVHPLRPEPVRGLRQQPVATRVEQHHAARLRIDELTDELGDPCQQDARIEVGSDQLADLEQRRRELLQPFGVHVGTNPMNGRLRYCCAMSSPYPTTNLFGIVNPR